MTWSSIQKPIVAGLGLATTLLLAAAGCGGDATETDDAVVVTDPSATVTAPAAAPASPAAAATPRDDGEHRPTAARRARRPRREGRRMGDAQGAGHPGGQPARREVLLAQGKAPKDPEVCAKEAPIPNERLVVDAASKGVKNVLVYIPKPTASTTRPSRPPRRSRSSSTRRIASSSRTSWAS